MRICRSTFRKIRREFCIYSTCDSMDSVIASKDMWSLLKYFFVCEDSLDSEVYETWKEDVKNLYYCNWADNKLLFCDKVAVMNVSGFSVVDYVAYKGYYLVLLTLGQYYGVDSNYLGVASVQDLCFVGSISRAFGGVSTPELSRLIMTTPEIDWEV